ncbi:MAG: hypothetical protein ABS949_17990 [Solibacillus sp.]
MHKMLIRSPQDEAGDTFGQLILVNTVNGQQYVFDVMKDEELDLEQEELYHSIFLSTVVPNLNLQDKENTFDRIFDAMSQLGLDDLLIDAEFQQVFKKIIEFELKGIPFLHEVPLAVQRLDLNYLIIEEEINRLVHLVLEDTLTRKDVVDFGRLLQAGELLFELPQLKYFEEPFRRMIGAGWISKSEQKSLEEIMRALRIEF